MSGVAVSLNTLRRSRKSSKLKLSLVGDVEKTLQMRSLKGLAWEGSLCEGHRTQPRSCSSPPEDWREQFAGPAPGAQAHGGLRPALWKAGGPVTQLGRGQGRLLGVRG